ncbi:winged helix-turn-helix transcriptional regulator [Phycicoccus sp. HDW14]|uniref:SatD family protein n=1 Tax=Phycicoccus sp. HDW14 TaxID=2714941 RepID=UPI00140A2E1E|nr:SatD family protein [Phycicoccus sp. HDW14]QIM20663.1 winged helix-turn-helix transcriptional regulator [Phycicoccus sp. HDW14]
MDEMKPDASLCVLIGDIVASRVSTDRRAVHDAVVAALAATEAVVPSVRGLRITVGDEFQGGYRTLGAALDAALRVRLALLPDVDVRIGVGRGSVTVLDAERGIEDGSAWWAARAAVEHVEATAERSPTRTLRTGYRAEGEDATVGAVNAALLCRDHLVGSLSDRSLRLLEGLMHPDTTQAQLAEREGVSASAVSQRVRADGVGVVLAAHELLRALP